MLKMEKRWMKKGQVERAWQVLNDMTFQPHHHYNPFTHSAMLAP
jgi:hypothetical protein